MLLQVHTYMFGKKFLGGARGLYYLADVAAKLVGGSSEPTGNENFGVLETQKLNFDAFFKVGTLTEGIMA